MSVFSHSVLALGEAAYIDAAEEDTVPDGLFWRVTPGGAADLPAGPVLLRHLRVEPEAVGAVDAATGLPPEPGSAVAPDAPVLLLPQSPPGAIVGWAYVEGDGDLRVAAISGRVAVGGGYVELSARTREPYAVAGHDMAGVVVSGDGRIIEAAFYALPSEFAGDIALGDAQVHAPPEDISLGCGFAAPTDPVSWQERIAAAAPRQSVPYALSDPNGPWSTDDEVNRAEQIARAGDSVLKWLHLAYDALGSDQRGVIEGATAEAGDPYRVVAAQTAAAALNVGALDPGIARWLGRSGMWPHGTIGAQWYGLLVATVPLHVYTRRLPAGFAVARNASDDSVYDSRIGAGGGYLLMLDEVQGWPPHSEFGAPDVLLAHVPMPYFVGVTPARPLRPRPKPPPAATGVPDGPRPRWAPDTPPRWEQSIAIDPSPVSSYALHGPVARGPVAFVRSHPSPKSLHPEIDRTGLAAPLLPGWDDSTGASVLSVSQRVAAEAEAVPVTWSVTLSDWVGRWGEAGTTAPLDPPAPPQPAPPTIEAGLHRKAPPAGSLAASPGDVHVLFRVPPATLPGALPVQQITWTVDGAPQPALTLAGLALDPKAAALLVRGRFAAKPTVPGQHRRAKIAARVRDSRGTPSQLAEIDIDAGDSRPLRAPTVAPHMLATSRRAAEPNVSVTLTVRAPADGAYRFYVASESALRTAAEIAAPAGATRAVRAQQLNEHAGATARRASMLALPEPVAVRSGVATARLEVPAGTVDVLAVRAIPVTAEVNAAGRIVRDGVEAPFASVKPVFVVVPYDEVPPTPDLTLTLNAGPPGLAITPVTAKITVRGVQTAVLNRYAREPIRARILEASTEGDPWFWPQIATTALTQSADDPTVFTAELTVDVPAWSRAAMAVAVRYPPEDMVVPGVDIVDEPELTAAGIQGERIESPWGPVSVPAWVQVEGHEPRILSTSDGAGGVRIQASGLPELAPGAPTFRLDVYSSAGGGLLEVSSNPVTPNRPEILLGPDIAAFGQRVFAVLVTPFDRYLTPTEITP